MISEERPGIVEARALTRRFGPVTAVDGIDISVPRGSSFAFVGPNGAGKTTFLRMVCGLTHITSGELEVDGKRLPDELDEVKRIIGVVPQDSNLDLDLTVRENLRLWATYFGLPKEAAAERAAELLHFMKLEQKSDALVPQLSGGMRRRLLIARALMNQPKLLILDEPTTGLDPLMRGAIWERVADLHRGGMTVLLTTHYMEEARALCDTVAVMRSGSIAAIGSPEDLTSRYGETLDEVFVHLTADTAAGS